MPIRPLILSLCSVVALAQAPAPQQPPQQPQQPTAPREAPQTPRAKPEPAPPPPREYIPEVPRFVLISGVVLMQDGGPVPDGTQVILACGPGNQTSGKRTGADKKGRFSFTMGEQTSRRRTGPRTVSDFFPVPVNLNGCTIRALLAGYRSTVAELAGRVSNEHYRVGPIIVSRLENAEGTAVSILSLQAPKDALKAYEKGTAAFRKRDWQTAQRHFLKAIEIYPKYVSAWAALGRTYLEVKNTGEARLAFERAIDLDPAWVEPYLPLAGISFEEKKWNEVLSTTGRLVRLDPSGSATAWLYNAIANLSLGKLDAAETSARAASKLDTERRMPRIEYVLGVVCANKRDYAGAAAHFRNYLAQAPGAPDAADVRGELAEIERRIAATR